MPTKAIILEWGLPFDGRETKAYELFKVNHHWWEELKKGKKIESYHIYGMMTGDMTTRSNMVFIEGTDDQIDTIRNSEEWKNNLSGFLTLLRSVRVNVLETGERVERRMQRYGDTVKKMIG